LEEAKLCWINGKKTQYVMDDATRRIVNIDGDIFNNSEYGVFVSDSTKSSMVKQNLEQLAQAAIQNQQATFSDIVAILETDSVSKAKSILKDSEQKAQERQQQQAQQEQEHTQKLQQMQIDAAREDREDRQAHEIEKERVKGDYKLREKEMDIWKFQEDIDKDKDGVPDFMEVQKFKQQQLNDNRDFSMRQKEMNLKEKELEVKKKQASSKQKNK